MLKIRMQRRGKKGHPTYRIVVVDSKAPRDGGNIVELLGYYDPQSKKENSCELKFDRIEYWSSVGAQKSITVTNLVKKSKKI